MGALALGAGTLISHGFGLALIPAMLPFIADELAVGYGSLGVAVAVGLVAYSLGALVAGRAVEALPSRTVLFGTYILAGIGFAVAATSQSVIQLAAAATITGFAAPVSWTATLHVAELTTRRESRAFVMTSASGGAALGVLINGVLVRTADSIHSWRTSFWMATAAVLIPLVLGLVAYRVALPPARPDSKGHGGTFRRVLETRGGRIVVIAGLVAGFAGFPFNVFLTATAIDEMGASAITAASIWWMIGTLGVVSGPLLGTLADRTSALRGLWVGAILYAAGAVVLAAVWNVGALAVAAFGYAFMNYPIWGLVGAIAGDDFDRPTALRAISLGLLVASLGGAVGNAIAGPWIERTGSFRVPAVVIALIALALALWYSRLMRADALIDNQASAQLE